MNGQINSINNRAEHLLLAVIMIIFITVTKLKEM